MAGPKKQRSPIIRERHGRDEEQCPLWSPRPIRPRWYVIITQSQYHLSTNPASSSNYLAKSDYTLPALTDLVRDLSGEKADIILQGRYQALKYLISSHSSLSSPSLPNTPYPLVRICALTDPTHSIWKPLKGPVRDWPLAWADIHSINPHRDMVPADRVYIDGVVESYWMRYHAEQRWCYLADQRADEALLFNSSDSGGGCAGGSFILFLLSCRALCGVSACLWELMMVVDSSAREFRQSAVSGGRGCEGECRDEGRGTLLGG